MEGVCVDVKINNEANRCHTWADEECVPTKESETKTNIEESGATATIPGCVVACKQFSSMRMIASLRRNDTSKHDDSENEMETESILKRRDYILRI
jgi:hypothetical protein